MLAFVKVVKLGFWLEKLKVKNLANNYDVLNKYLSLTLITVTFSFFLKILFKLSLYVASKQHTCVGGNK